ncbi:PadR family transcriptional regulator [Arthrobacter sp. H35-D1]|uniref:PadR family transcriptional regulator n=1 Tax=Arthrobacter sp. H35-D1 TaxID=3046202 RepID=UPI0024BA97A6|nr:PadR family transcriptional regulator [Arthrobacter sp. H35-D1]MDJ0313681.1 PadR family transcriptional regulator [Arthrobacter sp. H35-D1]
MSLTQAILTSLLEKPCTGAELARRFDKSLGYFWQATHQQIYRELGAMERDGLIAAHGLPTARGRQRHFTVLAPGRAALETWCAGEGELRPIRDELLVRMRGAAVLGTVDVSAELRRHQGLHHEVLQRYEAIAERDFPSGAQRSTADELQLAVLTAGIVYEKSWLAWCEDVLAGPAGD